MEADEGMNCYIATVRLNDERYMVYSEVRLHLEQQTLNCPCCGEENHVIVQQLQYQIRRMERTDEEVAPALYLEGMVAGIYDRELFAYVLASENITLPVIASREREGLDRIFLRTGQDVLIAGHLEKRRMEESVQCGNCGKKIGYWKDAFFVLENKGKILM